MNFIKYFRKDQAKGDNGPSVIGPPTNVIRDIHVIKNAETGQLEGLPTAWMRQIGNQITKAEQSNNPDAVLQAVKYYNYSMKRKDEPQEFKPFITEKDIHEETEALDKFMASRGAHESTDSESETTRNLELSDMPEFSNR